MPLDSRWIRFGEKDACSGYYAAPRGAAPLPGVIVIQEAWGVDDHMEDVTRRFAQAGYAALSPDLYAVDGARPAPITRERVTEFLAFFNLLPPGKWQDEAARETALAQLAPESRTRIEETQKTIFGGLRDPRHLATVQAAARFLRAENATSRGEPVGALGFCMGGGLAAALACADPELKAAIVFYGSAPEDESKIAAIRCPVLGLYGGLDARVNAGIPAFAAAMKRLGKRFEPVIYEGAQHAFFNDARPSYHAGATRDAFARTLTFLRENLAQAAGDGAR